MRPKTGIWGHGATVPFSGKHLWQSRMAYGLWPSFLVLSIFLGFSTVINGRSRRAAEAIFVIHLKDFPKFYTMEDFWIGPAVQKEAGKHIHAIILAVFRGQNHPIFRSKWIERLKFWKTLGPKYKWIERALERSNTALLNAHTESFYTKMYSICMI